MFDADRLHDLFETLKILHSIHEPNQLWKYVLERTCRSLKAEGGSFFIIGADGSRMELAAAVGVDEERLARVPMRVGTGVCGWVAQHRQPALIEKAQGDPRFNPFADQVTGRTTFSLLCVPVFAAGQTYGVVELVNGPFTAEAQEYMTIVGQQTAVAYQNLLLSRETSKTKVLLESLLLNMSGGLIAMDATGVVTILNPAARQLLSLSALDNVGKPAVALLMDYPALLEPLHKALQSGATVSRQETTVAIRGAACLFGYSTILITDPDRQILGSGIIFQKLS